MCGLIIVYAEKKRYFMFINPIIRGRVVSKTNTLDVKLKIYFNNFTLESQEKKIFY